MKQLGSTPVDIINQAVINIALRHGLIIRIENCYKNNIIGYDYLEVIETMQVLAKTIRDSNGKTTSTNAEYFKLLNQFVLKLAAFKKMSVEAIYEMVLTEVQAVANSKAQSDEVFDEVVKTLFKAMLAFGAIAIVWTIGSSVVGAINQRFTNAKEIEQIRTENAQLQQENQQLRAIQAEFDTFKNERTQVDKVKAENEALKRKNEALNDKLAYCKSQPFWARCE